MRELPLTGGASPPIRLRAHTVLCLQGFRGKGYSASFVDNMAAVSQSLQAQPDQVVEIGDAPDALCAACPHRAVSGCELNGPESEEAMRAQDHDVLARLRLHPGDRLAWRDLVERITSAVGPDDLGDICGSCRWLPLGYCREGLEDLQRRGRRP